jgi:hypothetical protein
MAVTKIVLEQVSTTTETAVQSDSVDYTPAIGKIFSIVSMWMHNANSTAKYCKVKIGATLLVGVKQIPANDTLMLDDVNLYLVNGEYIATQAEADTGLAIRINGLEVDA